MGIRGRWLRIGAIGSLYVCVAVPAASAQDPTPPVQDPPPAVDLSGDEYESLSELERQGQGERTWVDRWFERVTLSGYGAFAYLQTQQGGIRPEGALMVTQASLFLQAEVSDRAMVLFEVWLDRFGGTATRNLRIGEAYAQFHRVCDWEDDGFMGLKVGRFDIPFGEYYLYWDSPNNPLVSYPVGLPYRYDEGVMAFGRYRGVQFQGAFLDGSGDRQGTNGFAKSVVAKISGEPLQNLYASASALWTGDTSSTALCFAGSTITPVGAGMVSSSLGASPSSEVSLQAFEADLRYRFGHRGYLALSLGHARIDDQVDSFDRDFTWFVIEPSYVITAGWRATVRYSEIGTYDGNAGYEFEGKQYGNGSASYGFDTQRLSRLAAGLAWEPAPQVMVKGEVGYDRFVSIDASPFADDTRGFVALELVLSF